MDLSYGSTLRAIRSMDPEGWEREPTAADRREFREWVKRTYGAQAWLDYNTDWDRANVA